MSLRGRLVVFLDRSTHSLHLTARNLSFTFPSPRCADFLLLGVFLSRPIPKICGSPIVCDEVPRAQGPSTSAIAVASFDITILHENIDLGSTVSDRVMVMTLHYEVHIHPITSAAHDIDFRQRVLRLCSLRSYAAMRII